MNLAADVSQNLFEAMSIVMDAQIKKYKYDVTIEARIVSTEQKDDGIYKVEYEDAIFDAYSAGDSRYYEGDTVYVHVPKGDFSEQKHIVGRKVDLDKEPEKTFKFKRPFDDFIQLNNLTYNVSSTEHGYIANYPPHGADNDAIDYSVELANLTNELNLLQQKYNVTRSAVTNYIIDLPEVLTAVNTGYTITDQYPDKSQLSYYELIQNTLSLNPQTLTQLDEVIRKAKEQLIGGARTYQNLPAFINASEWRDIRYMMEAARTRLLNYVDDTYNNAATALQNEQSRYQDLSEVQEASKEDNVNWLYTWHNESNEPVLFTHLGVSIDVRTLLGNYRPQRGKYGLKLVIRGLTRPTEESATVSKIETVYFRNTEDFYGNTYAYYSPYTQQKLFNISNYLRIDRIDVYFWQDHDFIDDSFAVIPYEDNNGNLYPANIIVSNLNLSMGVDVNDFDVDKVFLYTYDDLYYGKDPYTNENRSEKDSRHLQFAWVHKLDDGSAELINTPEQLEEYNAHIYWYHYEYGVAQDTSVYAERQGGINWKWIQNENNNFTIDVVPDIKVAREQYRAILEYNNIPLRSDPLELFNIDQSVVTNVDDLTNEIVFRLLREDKDGNIVEDNTLANFYCYDENNLCIYDDENIRYSDKWYYIQVWIRNNDTGGYVPLCIDDDPNSFEIVWTAPIDQLSMINQFVQVENRDLDKAVLMPTSASISANRNDNIRKVTRKFRIRNRWDMRYIENTISAQINRNGRIYNLQKELFFGQSGSMGSEYTITIHQYLPNSPYMIQNEQFTLFATVANQEGVEVPSTGYRFTWELLSPTVITESKNESIQGKTWQDSLWTVSNMNGYSGNTISGFVRNNLPPIFRVTMNGAAQYPIYQTTGFKLTDSQSFNSSYVVSVPNRVEFKSDGKAPITLTSSFWVAQINQINGNVVREIYPDWYLKQYYKSTYSKQWTELNEPDYFDLKEKVQLKREVASNTDPNLYVELNQNGSIAYDGEIKSTSFESTTAMMIVQVMKYSDLRQKAEEEYAQAVANNVTNAEQRYEDYLDKINLAASKLVPSHTLYALNPYMNNNIKLSTAWAWDDLMLKNYYTYIGFESNGQDGQPYYMRQAIAMTRNEYSSSLVNSWDGSLLVDKENNAFLSKMVSAGSKDSDNRFTGVIMGDWADNGDASIDDVGIYGFERGAQVFGLKTDGTGFIGKAGKGQIQFDGNYSLISNYDKSCYINLDPILFSDVNVFDEKTTMGYSSYFLYAKVPKKSTSSAVGEVMLSDSTYWAVNFMNDTVNDYFIVDPNNGILTTGGIIARYGKLGNWMISSDGLYQKSVNVQGQTVKYMYLGYKPRHAAEDSNNTALINTIADENYAIWCADTDSPYATPYFSVSWDGEMRSRKGRIGLHSPWIIDDYGLTQKNNFGMIYIGAPQKYLTARTQTYDQTDFIMWAGFVGSNTNTDQLVAGDSYFAILADGTLFSRRGSIAGWSITDNNLTSASNSSVGRMRFNSQYGQIIIGEKNVYGAGATNQATVNTSQRQDADFSILIDGMTGRIVLKHQDEYGSNYTTGEIWLANYILASSTAQSIRYPYMIGAAQSASKTITLTSQSGGGDTGWDTTLNVTTSSFSYSVSYQTWKTDTDTYFNMTNDNDLMTITTNYGSYANTGVALCVGMANNEKNQNANSVKTVVWYPYNHQYAVLGTVLNRWNLMADTIDANKMTVGVIYASGNVYVNGDEVALKPWVVDRLQELTDALNGLAGDLTDLAEEVAELAKKIAGQAIVSGKTFTLAPDQNNGQAHLETSITLKTKSGTSTTVNPEAGGYVASVAHSHDLEIDPDNGSLKFHITTGVVNPGNRPSFNIRDYQWYAQQIADAYNRGVSDTIAKIGNVNISHWSHDDYSYGYSGSISSWSYASISVPTSGSIDASGCLGKNGADVPTAAFNSGVRSANGSASGTWVCLGGSNSGGSGNNDD